MKPFWKEDVSLDSIGIYNLADEIVRQYGTRRPDAIADGSGIQIFYSNNLKKLLGMYTCQNNNRIIIVNDRLDAPLKEIVKAHEIGHDELHRELVQEDGLMEFRLLNATNGVEYEANVFAAHLLLSDDDVYSALKQGYDIQTVSKMLSTETNLLMIKIKEMNKLGYKIPLTNEYDRKFFDRMSDGLS